MRRLRYALVLLLALELAVWESFLVAARPLGHPLPLAAVLAAVANVAMGLTGAKVLGRTLGAALPGLVWLLVALPLASQRAEGDLVVTGGWRGVAFLLAGAAAAVVALGVADARQKGTTPEARSRR